LGRLPFSGLALDEPAMKRMQMWLTTRDTNEPIVKVGDDGYWVTPLGNDVYLVTRVSDSRRMGVFSVDATERLRVTGDGPDTDQLLEKVALAAKRARFVH
jgi:hypothetical protein